MWIVFWHFRTRHQWWSNMKWGRLLVRGFAPLPGRCPSSTVSSRGHTHSQHRVYTLMPVLPESGMVITYRNSQFGGGCNKRTTSFVVLDGILETPHLAQHTWQCHCISVVPEATVFNLTIYIIPVTLNTEADALRLTSGNSHTNHSIKYGKRYLP